MSQLPALSGKDLISLLTTKDDWTVLKRMPHGLSLIKRFPDGSSRRTTVKDTRKSIPKTTLGLILGPKQTGIGSDGLLELLNR